MALRIRTQLKLIGLLPLLLAVVYGLALYRGQARLTELRSDLLLIERMQIHLVQVEATVLQFARTRDARARHDLYQVLEALDRHLLRGDARLDGDGQRLLADLRDRLVRVRWQFMTLDGLYLPLLTALEVTQLQQRLAQLLGEIRAAEPLLHRLHRAKQREVVDYSNALWQGGFLLIAVTAVVALLLMYPVLNRVAHGLQVLSRGARQLGGDKRPPALWLSGNDELAQVVRDFAQMAERLERAEAARALHTRELQNALSDLENFSYSVSHDLRAPLRAIDGFIAILAEDYGERLDAEGLRLFAVVRDNATKMEQLIDDILALSRAGRMQLQLIEVDMNRLVDEVWTELAEQHPAEPLDFRCDPLPPALCDPRAIRQVWRNLLGNAIKFSRGRQPARIRVSAEVQEGCICYRVADNGIGFDPAYSDKLFGLFSRLHGTEEREGTGVGLAVVKRFVVQHQGSVAGHGTPDGGATFSFSLPRDPKIPCGEPYAR